MPLPWERQWNTGPALPPDDDSVQAYITEAATKRGIPVEDALRVWEGEGKGAWQSNFRKGGVREPSYGPYQLYKGGGLGNAFQEATGLDPADPATWQQGVDFALDTAKKEGWRQWYGAPPELRSRGGYVDPESPSLGAVGARPWERKWKAPAVPTDEAPEQVETQELGPNATAEEIHPPVDWNAVGDDAARSVISGTVSGLTGLAGLPGTIGDYVNERSEKGSWLDTISSYLGELPNIDEIQNTETPLGRVGDAANYDPQYITGEVAQNAAGIAAGGPLLGRSDSLVRGTAKKGAEVVGAGGAMELGEEIGGPVGGTAAAILATHSLGKPIPNRGQPIANAADRAISADDMVMSPKTAALARRSGANYDRLERMGIAIPHQQFAGGLRAASLTDDLASLGYTPQKYPGLARLLDQSINPLGGMGGGGAAIGFRQFDNIRQQFLKHARTSGDPQERMMAGRIVDALDGIFDDATQGLRGNAARTAARARADWRTFRKSEEVDKMAEVIKDKAARFSVSGEDNAVRDVFSRLSTRITKDRRARNMFTNDEIRLIRKLARGDGLRHTLRQVGAAVNNPLTRGTALMGGIGGSLYMGDASPFWGAVATILGGKAARGLASRSASKGVKRLGNLVRSGGQLTPPSHPLAAGLMSLNSYLGQ